MDTLCTKTRKPRVRSALEYIALATGDRFLLILTGVLCALAFVSRRVISRPVPMST
jgi:hypothetical protein